MSSQSWQRFWVWHCRGQSRGRSSIWAGPGAMQRGWSSEEGGAHLHVRGWRTLHAAVLDIDAADAGVGQLCGRGGSVWCVTISEVQAGD